MSTGSQVGGRKRPPDLTVPLIALLLVAGCSSAIAQRVYPVFTVEDLGTAMKAVGRYVAAVDASLRQNEFQTAKNYLARSREQLAPTITFWRDQQKDDAVGWLQDTLRQMDRLDAALSADNPDRAAVNAAATQLAAACEACHAMYRERDPATKAFRITPGSAKFFTLDDLVTSMKAVGQFTAALNVSLAEGDFKAAKARLAPSREQLAETIGFWRNQKRDDAIRFLRAAVREMNQLDAALSANRIDSATVNILAKQVDAACEACHEVYREQDPVTKAYIVKFPTFDSER
jgi:cytochrome c556